MPQRRQQQAQKHIVVAILTLCTNLLETLQASGEDGLLGLQLSAELLLALDAGSGGRGIVAALQRSVSQRYPDVIHECGQRLLQQLHPWLALRTPDLILQE